MALISKYIKEQNFADYEALKAHFNEKKVSVKNNNLIYMLMFTDDSDWSDPVIRECNGVIFEKDTNALLHYSFSKAYDGLETENHAADEHVKDVFHAKEADLVNSTLEVFFEGTLMKVFYHNDKWNVSTSHHLDARKNFWTSKRSYFELFCESIKYAFDKTFDEFTEKCDKNYCYSYLLQHPENLMVIRNEILGIIPVNKVHLETRQEYQLNEGEFIVTKKYHELEDERPLGENFMLYVRDDKKKVTARVKFLSPKFMEAMYYRGNSPNILMSYIAHWYDEEAVKKFKSFFPKEESNFTKFDMQFAQMCDDIHGFYIRRHIKHEMNLDVPPKYNKSLYQLHKQYLRTRKPIRRDDVINLVAHLKPRSVIWLMKD